MELRLCELEMITSWSPWRRRSQGTDFLYAAHPQFGNMWSLGAVLAAVVCQEMSMWYSRNVICLHKPVIDSLLMCNYKMISNLVSLDNRDCWPCKINNFLMFHGFHIPGGVRISVVSPSCVAPGQSMHFYCDLSGLESNVARSGVQVLLIISTCSNLNKVRNCMKSSQTKLISWRGESSLSGNPKELFYVTQKTEQAGLDRFRSWISWD